MKRSILLLTLVGAMLFACAEVALAQARAPTTPQPDRYIVVLKEDADPEQGADKAQRQHGAKVRHVYDGEALNGYAAVIPAGRLAALSRDPDVAFINKDALVYADISTGGATGVDRVDGEPNNAGVSDGNGAKAAVLDTGIDLDHPDLAPNVVNGKNTISTTGTPSSDCSVGRTNTSADDDNGHGTHVAGTIGAKNDGAGVVGVAPGAKLYAVKVLNAQGSGYVSDIICGINWVTSTRTDADPNNNIDVANMSLGGTGTDDVKSCAQTTNAYKKAICNSVGEGVTYVVSAGNDGADLANKRPASFRDRDDTTGKSKPLVLTVTAITDYNGQPGGGAPATCRTGTDDTPASFSNYATNPDNQAHTIAAPGVCIKSTWKAGAYNTISGTSMAAPHVAGTVAMCRARSQCTALPADIITKLRGDAQTEPAHPTYGWNGAPGTSKYYGYMVYAGSYRSGAAPVAKAPTQSFGPRLGTSTIPVKLSWSASDADGSIVAYQLQQSTNGGAYSNVSLPSSTATTISRNLTRNYTYQFRVRAQDTSGNWSRWAQGPSFKVEAYQENSTTGVSYPSGTWTRSYLSGAYGSYIRRASAAGATARFSFQGRNVGWVATKASNRGKADVYVDGVYQTTVDLYSSTQQTRQVVFQRSWNTSGSHTVEVRLQGTSGRPYGDVDAFVALR